MTLAIGLGFPIAFLVLATLGPGLWTLLRAIVGIAREL